MVKHRLTLVLFLLIAWLPGFSQTNSNSPHPIQQSGSTGTATPGKNDCKVSRTPHSCVEADQRKAENTPQQTKRILGVVPNFAAVSANTQFEPLTTRQKFHVATEDSFDYSSFVWTGILAAQSLALDSDPELGSGGAGYARYYWRGFADGVSGTYFTEAIVPAITHEDPRYFTSGHGGFLRRLGYSLSRTVVTKTDSGGLSFNWSEVGGNLLEAGLSNAYYPPQERGVGQTFRDWGTQMESAALNNIVKEFWPDIHQKLFGRH